LKKVLFDVGHPAQVYQFSIIAKLLKEKGWEYLYVAKDKEISKYLLEILRLNHHILSKNKKGLIKKVLNIPKDDFQFYKIVRRFKPDFILNRFSIHSGHISKLLNITNIGFSDTEHANKLHKITLPFIDVKLTGVSYYNDLGKNHFKYNSNIEFFYLHPDVFTESCDPYDILNIDKTVKYCLVRFVSWDAHHDIGIERLSNKEKIDLVEILARKMKVFISAEGILPNELKSYQIHIPSEHMHTVLKNASLYIGEGGTMASEAACLNTPVIYTNNLPLMGYLKEQQDFGLLYHKIQYREIVESINLALEERKRRYNDYMSNKINPSEFVVWFLENYPKSKKIMKENPDYQYKFK
jgi:predicted glycosyltransferase